MKERLGDTPATFTVPESVDARPLRFCSKLTTLPGPLRGKKREPRLSFTADVQALPEPRRLVVLLAVIMLPIVLLAVMLLPVILLAMVVTVGPIIGRSVLADVDVPAVIDVVVLVI